MTDLLNDLNAELRDLKRRIRVLESASPLGQSSISEGALEIRSAEGLIVEGSAKVSGTLSVSGEVTISNGQLVVNGAVPIRLRQVSGSARIDFGDAGRIFSQHGIVLINAGTANIGVGNDALIMSAAGKEIGVDSSGISFAGVPTLPPGTEAEYLVIGPGGKIYKSPGMGGHPGGDPTPGTDLGNFQWPFPLTTVTSEYGPRDGRIHEGIDFGISPATAGAPIIAAGDGVVAVNTFSSGWGNYVRLTHNAGGGQRSTLYAHMNAPGLPAVGASVTKGQVIGYVGNTGNSFGAHLHFETWMSTSYGSHVNPRSFMAAFGPE